MPDNVDVTLQPIRFNSKIFVCLNFGSSLDQEFRSLESKVWNVNFRSKIFGFEALLKRQVSSGKLPPVTKQTKFERSLGNY